MELGLCGMCPVCTHTWVTWPFVQSSSLLQAPHWHSGFLCGYGLTQGDPSRTPGTWDTLGHAAAMSAGMHWGEGGRRTEVTVHSLISSSIYGQQVVAPICTQTSIHVLYVQTCMHAHKGSPLVEDVSTG